MRNKYIKIWNVSSIKRNRPTTKKSETHKTEKEMRHALASNTVTVTIIIAATAATATTTTAIESQSLRCTIDEDRLSECFKQSKADKIPISSSNFVASFFLCTLLLLRFAVPFPSTVTASFIF